MVRRLKNTILFWFARAALALLFRLPQGVLLKLGPLLGRVGHLFAGAERRRALGNLKAADLGLDPRSRARLVRRVFVGAGRTVAECLALPRQRRWLGTGHSPVRFEPGALDVLQEALDGGRGVVFVTAHVGNWELMGAEVAHQAPVSVLARGSYDPRFTRMIDEFRSGHGVRSLWVEHRAAALRGALAALRAAEVVGVLLDQPPPRSGRPAPHDPSRGGRVPTDFLGRPASTSTVAAALARGTGARVVVGFAWPADDGGQHVAIEPVPLAWTSDRGADLARATAELTRRIEGAVRRDPSCWLWTLDRWRAVVPQRA